MSAALLVVISGWYFSLVCWTPSRISCLVSWVSCLSFCASFLVWALGFISMFGNFGSIYKKCVVING